MNIKEYAYWIADKIVDYDEYTKEAASVLRRQADELEAANQRIRESQEQEPEAWLCVMDHLHHQYVVDNPDDEQVVDDLTNENAELFEMVRKPYVPPTQQEAIDKAVAEQIENACEAAYERGRGHLMNELLSKDKNKPEYENAKDMIPNMLKGGYSCPLCGKDTPHEHTPIEIIIYRNGVKYGNWLSEENNHE